MWTMRGTAVVVAFLIVDFAAVEAQTSSRETDINKCCSRKPNSTSPESGCVPTRLLANQFQNTIVTPGFPKPFPPETFCKWEVHAPAGKRIWLDIRNMDLIRKEENECKFQKLIIRSPLTGLSMGPYCGHDGLPNIVSTGNYLIVELQSPYPTEGREYAGFKMVYMETVQSTSPELRPIDWSDGMFINSDKDPFTKPTRPPRFRPTSRTTTKAEEMPPTSRTSTKKSPKKPKPSPVNRIKSQNLEWSTPYPVQYGPVKPPPRTHVLVPRHRDENTALGTEGIVGIIVGSIVAVGIISVIVAKVSFYRSNKRMKRDEEMQRNKNYNAREMYPVILPDVKIEQEGRSAENRSNSRANKDLNKRKRDKEISVAEKKETTGKYRRKNPGNKKDRKETEKKINEEPRNTRARRPHEKRSAKNSSERSHLRSNRREHRKSESISDGKKRRKRTSRR